MIIHIRRLLFALAILLTGGVQAETVPQGLLTLPALHPKDANGTVPRPIMIGTSAPRDAAHFYARAIPLGAAEVALIYPTVGKPETLAFPDYQPETRIILALKFFPKPGCGAGPNGIPPKYSKGCPGVLEEILTGRFDPDLDEIGKRIVKDGRGVTIRHLYEGNGEKYPWQAYYPANRASDFVPAWRHVADVLRTSAGNLVAFEFNMNRTSRGKPLATDFRDLYPGNDYVDRVSIDSYNRCGSSPNYPKWKSFAEEFRPPYQAVLAVIGDTSIPIGIGETGTSPITDPPVEACLIDRIDWYAKLFEAVEDEFTRVDEIILFLERVKKGAASNAVAMDWGIPDPAQVRAFCMAANAFRHELNATYRDLSAVLVPSECL